MPEHKLRIRVAGHEEGDLIVYSLASNCGAITNGIAVRFENKEGVFVLNLADLERVLIAAKGQAEGSQK